MQIALYSKYQFINQAVLNAEQSLLYGNWQTDSAWFATPGLANPGSLTITPTGLIVNIAAPIPFGVQFSSGVFAQGFGTTAGATSSNYSVNASGSVPASGSVTCYIVAQAAQVSAVPYQIVGPPPGHPDYDPTFAPITGYAAVYDTFNLVATTVAPNNTTNIEICRFSLAAGAGSIPASTIVTAFQINAASFWATGSNQLLSAFQSGAAANSPYLRFTGWTGTATTLHQIYESSGSNLTFQGSAGTNTIVMDQTMDLFIVANQTGGAANSPYLEFLGWTGTLDTHHRLYEAAGGSLTFIATAGTNNITLDQNLNFNISSMQSGAATNSPYILLQGWTGAATTYWTIRTTGGTGTPTGPGSGQLYFQPLSSANFITFDPTSSMNLWARQSGAAGNSPSVYLVGWTGTAIAYHSIFENSTGSLTIEATGTSNFVSFDQVMDAIISVKQSGGAAASPFMRFQGWTGSAQTFHQIFENSTGVFTIQGLAGTDLTTIDQNGLVTINASHVAGTPLTVHDTSSGANAQAILDINNAGNYSLNIYPQLTAGSYNSLVQVNDTALVATAAGAAGGGVLTCTSWSATAAGIRIMPTGDIYSAGTTLQAGVAGVQTVMLTPPVNLTAGATKNASATLNIGTAYPNAKIAILAIESQINTTSTAGIVNGYFAASGNPSINLAHLLYTFQGTVTGITISDTKIIFVPLTTGANPSFTYEFSESNMAVSSAYSIYLIGFIQ